MYGAFEEVAAGPTRALRSGADMIGIGLCPEGIEQNPAAYALMNEWAFRRVGVYACQWHARDKHQLCGGQGRGPWAAYDVLAPFRITCRQESACVLSIFRAQACAISLATNNSS